MQNNTTDIDEAVAIIERISVVPVILEIVCYVTGMGFAAVARVTQDRWIACDVRDLICFGLKRGGELKIDTTLCNEIRDSRTAIIIDHVVNDAEYCGHHTPATYGLQSYISVPIILADNDFFGTLCAIDPNPAKLKNSAIPELFSAYADLIAFLIDAVRLNPGAATQLRQRAVMSLRAHLVNTTGHTMERHTHNGNNGEVSSVPLDEVITKAVADVRALSKSLSAAI
ncbi:MAG: GAF domain-containing protein [Sphingobacteriales bacterium]|nr:MAG: GAF domain-containing protein [Sphingobacteriales bacterium]